MPRFTSPRERKLWLFALLAVGAIVVSMAFATSVASDLRDRNLVSNGFWLGMWLIGAAIAASAWKRRAGKAEIWVWLGVAGAYLIAFLRMAVPEERSHLIEYSVVALLVYAALRERDSNGEQVPYPAILAIAITSLVGFVDECIQLFIPTRVFDWFDILFNFLAGLMAVCGSAALDWARRKAIEPSN